jgi:hypothetical protein
MNMVGGVSADTVSAPTNAPRTDRQGMKTQLADHRGEAPLIELDQLCALCRFDPAWRIVNWRTK